MLLMCEMASVERDNDAQTPSTPCGGEVLHVCLKMSCTKRPM